MLVRAYVHRARLERQMMVSAMSEVLAAAFGATKKAPPKPGKDVNVKGPGASRLYSALAGN